MTGIRDLAKIAPFLAIMAIAGYFYYLADHFDFEAMPGRVGPDLWPKIILGLMLLTCAIGILKAILTRRMRSSSNLLAMLAPQHGEADHEGGDEQAMQTWLHLPLLGIALFVAYVLLLDRVGFVICTAVLIAAFLYLGRYRNYWIIAAAALVGSLGFFFVFRRLVYISLPLGQEPFLSLSVLLMKLMGMS